MQKSRWAILEQNDGWWIAQIGDASPQLQQISTDKDATAERIGQAIAAQMIGQGYTAEEDAILCLASSNCLAAKLSLGAANTVPSHEALSFQLEEMLPVSAEHFVTDFVTSESGILGIAVVTETIRPLVQAVELAGISIRSIIPATLLATQSLTQSSASLSKNNAILVWPFDGAFDVISLQGGAVSDWLYVRGDSSVLEQNLWMLMSDREQEVPVHVCGDDALLSLKSSGDLRHYPRIAVPSFSEMVASAASEVLLGQLTPLIDLRRDKLASRTPYHSLQKLITTTAIAACLLLVATIVGLEYRSWRYEQAAQEYQQAMEQVFLQVFPKQQIPLGIRSRLESEHSKTASLRDTKKIPEVASAVDTFHAMLKVLPETIRYRMTEITVQGRQLKMDGEVRTHGDAASLATLLTETGFEVQPPRTVQASGGNVSVALAAEFRPTTKPQKEKPPQPRMEESSASDLTSDRPTSDSLTPLSSP